MRKLTLADHLDRYLETASEQEMRGIVASLTVWARARHMPFRVVTEELVKPLPLLNTTKDGSKPDAH